jgi:lipopolysaccharide export system permease protein
VYRGRAVWEHDRLVFSGSAERISFADGRVTAEKVVGGELHEPVDPLAGAMRKPSHMTSGELSRVSAGSGSDTERQMYSVALEKRRTTPFVPLVIAIFTAPFSLSLSRKGKAATVGYAVGLWLLFTGVSSVFEQFGLSGSVSPSIAVWSPLVIFAAVGIYLLTRVRT